MMHGSLSLDAPEDQRSPLAWVRAQLKRRKWIVFVVLPTLLLSIYFGLIAAPQYESEAHFVVRSASGSSQGQAPAAISIIGGSANVSADTASVSDYLSSHDAVEALRRKNDLVAIYRRPEADIIAKLHPADPSPERLHDYFEGHSSVKLDPETGITTIRVQTFRPQDSVNLVNSLLELGEGRVNVLNKRAYESSLAMARLQLQDAENRLSKTQQDLTTFRQGRRNIDPEETGKAQILVVSNLQASLAQARAQRAAMVAAIRPNSPQARAMDQRIAAISEQVARESSRLAGSGNAIASNIGDYQGLTLRQQFASKRYDDAAATLQRAREQAIKQQLFVVRIVEPNLPVKALYPKGFRVVFTVFIGLLLAYACGWLIAAGVREHAA